MRSASFSISSATLLFLTLAALTAGCGIKGGLYYPPPPKAPSSASQTTNQSVPVEASAPQTEAQSATPATPAQ